MKDTRRRFSREFKLEAVRQLASGRRQADVARELGVDAQVIRRWADQVKIDLTTAFPGNGRAPREEAELQRLRNEVAQLRAERDFLKKTAVGSTDECNGIDSVLSSEVIPWPVLVDLVYQLDRNRRCGLDGRRACR